MEKCLRGRDALKSCNCIKVMVKTGNVWDTEMLSLQYYQSIMEIQTAGMPVNQLQDSREQAFYTPTAPVRGMLAAKFLKTSKSTWPLSVLLAFGQPATQYRDGFVHHTIKDQDFPMPLLKCRP